MLLIEKMNETMLAQLKEAANNGNHDADKVLEDLASVSYVNDLTVLDVIIMHTIFKPTNLTSPAEYILFIYEMFRG